MFEPLMLSIWAGVVLLLRAIKISLLALAVVAGVSWCTSAMAASIYKCVDAQGKQHREDHLIVECADRLQYKLNADGSTAEIIKPNLSEDDRLVADAAARQKDQIESEKRVRALADRQLVLRYPDEQAYARGRQEALNVVMQSIAWQNRRKAELLGEQKKLQQEREFYLGRRLPPKLQSDVDANNAGLEGQAQAEVAATAELKRINELFDSQLVRLNKLWNRK